MAAQVCKNGVFDVFRVIYSFQFRIKMHGLNEFKIINNHVWAKENNLYAAHHIIISISIFIQMKKFILLVRSIKKYLYSIRKYLQPI